MAAFINLAILELCSNQKRKGNHWKHITSGLVLFNIMSRKEGNIFCKNDPNSVE